MMTLASVWMIQLPFGMKVAERTDALVRLRNEARDAEEKLREAVESSQHQTELIKQLRDELKQAKAKVGTCRDKRVLDVGVWVCVCVYVVSRECWNCVCVCVRVM